MTEQHIYIFSGLGADKRVFERMDFRGRAHTFICWERPLRAEQIGQYAHRLLDQIKHVRPILLGLSFGGMMAVEVAKLIEVERVILISSAETRSDIPFYYRWIGVLRLHRLLPTGLFVRPTRLANWFFGATTSHDKAMLALQLQQTDAVFLAWAIDQIVRWGNKCRPSKLVHITGSADRILPCWAKRYDVKIEGGGHLMVYNRSDEVSEEIERIMNNE